MNFIDACKRSRNTVRRNAAILPAYSFVLGLLALLGWVAIAAGTQPIGALVPAAIMSIAAANTFSRNIHKEWLKKDATPAQEAKVSQLMSLLVKGFALVLPYGDPDDIPGNAPAR